MAQLLRERYYTSVSDFSRDLSQKIGEVLVASANLGTAEDADIAKIHSQLNEVRPGTAEHIALTHEQKELKKLAKRIVKAVKEPIEEAMKKEAELRGLEHDEELRKLDSMGIFASAKTNDGEDAEEGGGRGRISSDMSVDGVIADPDSDTEMFDANEKTDEAVIHLKIDGKAETIPLPNNNPTPASNAGSWTSTSHEQTIHTTSEKPTEPISPPMSTANSIRVHINGELRDFFAHGGVPWYLEPFDPVGTTVHDERYTGRAVLRDMSEELSDMDEDTLTELAGNGVEHRGSVSMGVEDQVPVGKKAPVRKPAPPRRNKKRGR